MGSNKTDNYSAAMRFSDEGAEVFINDDFIEDALRGLGHTVEYSPSFISENPEKVVTQTAFVMTHRKYAK